MKRYGLLLLTLVLTVGAFSWHYFSVEAAYNQKPEFTFKTSRGNKKYVDNLKLFGTVYQSDDIYNQTSFIQKGEETLYEEDFSFSYQLDYIFHAHPSIQRLYEEYPKFIKRNNYGNFFVETPETIVEASVDWEKQQSTSATIQVEKFNKVSEDIKKYTFNLPLDNPAEYSYLESIEVVENKLIVFLTHVGEDEWEDGMNTTSIEMLVYQLDLETEKIISVEPFLEQFSANDFSANTSISALNSINGYNQYEQKENSLFFINHDNEGELQNFLANYNSIENNYTILDIKEEWLELGSSTEQVYEGDKLYLVQRVEAGFTIRVFNINENELETTLNISVGDSLMLNYGNEHSDINMRVAVNEDLLYIVSDRAPKGKEGIVALVVDLYTGQSVYEGTLEAESLSEEWKPLGTDIQFIRIVE